LERQCNIKFTDPHRDVCFQIDVADRLWYLLEENRREALMKHSAWMILVLLLPAFAFAESVSQARHIEMAARGIHRLEVICGAGSLDVKGIEDSNTIRVAAQVEVENVQKRMEQAFIDQNMHLDMKKTKDTAVLRSEFGPTAGKGAEARINLVVEVPLRLDVKIIDTSGPIRVKETLGNIEIDDESGKIEVETVEGNVTVKDGSGSILIEDIDGKVSVRDGSGPMEIYHVEGDVVVTDGSGEIIIRQIEGNVTVSDDTGDITIDGVSGNVFINEAGSGDLVIDNVGGRTTVREYD